MNAVGRKAMLFFVILLSLAFPKKVEGSYIYGGEGGPGQILVDKTVKNPVTGEWFDNLDSSTVVFTAKDKVDFKIKIKNTGSEKLTNINVTDTLPPYVDFISGPGEYKTDTRELSWTIGELEAGAEQVFDLQVRVWEAEKLPQGGTVCVVNRVWAKSGDKEDSDTSQFCIETRILAEKIPETGVDFNLALQTLGCLSLLGVGWRLRKYR